MVLQKKIKKKHLCELLQMDWFVKINFKQFDSKRIRLFQITNPFNIKIEIIDIRKVTE